MGGIYRLVDFIRPRRPQTGLEICPLCLGNIPGHFLNFFENIPSQTTYFLRVVSVKIVFSGTVTVNWAGAAPREIRRVWISAHWSFPPVR